MRALWIVGLIAMMIVETISADEGGVYPDTPVTTLIAFYRRRMPVGSV